MITSEYLHEVLDWAKRELLGMGPLALEGMMLKELILDKRRKRLPLDAIEGEVVALNAVLEVLQQQRRFANSRQVALDLLLNIPDFRHHLAVLETYPDISDETREMLIRQFKNGEYYGSNQQLVSAI